MSAKNSPYNQNKRPQANTKKELKTNGQALANKGAFHPKKNSGRLCFDREELDRVLANGDHKKGRGGPRKG